MESHRNVDNQQHEPADLNVDEAKSFIPHFVWAIVAIIALVIAGVAVTIWDGEDEQTPQQALPTPAAQGTPNP